MRLFIGTWVRYELFQQLTTVLDYYANEHPNLKWTTADKLHLTLLYLGETDQGHLPLIKKQLHYIAQKTAVMLGECHKPCLLPSKSNPKVLAYQLKTQPNLMQLHQYLQHALMPGEDYDTRDFKPHITLARQPKLPQDNYNDLTQTTIEPPTPTAPLIIDHMALVSAPVSQTGSIYQTLDEYSLRR